MKKLLSLLTLAISAAPIATCQDIIIKGLCYYPNEEHMAMINNKPTHVATASVPDDFTGGIVVLPSVTHKGIKYTVAYFGLSDCEGATSVSLPNTIYEINDIENCPNLRTINIPASVEFTNDITGCPGLRSINVAPGNPYFKSIDGVLYKKKGNGLDLLMYPAGKTDSIATIAPSTDEIRKDAFTDCKNLTRIVIPQSVSVVETDFRDCINLKEFQVSPDNNRATSVDGIIYSKDKTRLWLYPRGKTDETFTIPSFASEVTIDGMIRCKALRTLIIPETVKYIYSHDCENDYLGIAELIIEGSNPAVSPNEFSTLAHKGKLTTIKVSKSLNPDLRNQFNAEVDKINQSEYNSNQNILSIEYYD